MNNKSDYGSTLQCLADANIFPFIVGLKKCSVFFQTA